SGSLTPTSSPAAPGAGTYIPSAASTATTTTRRFVRILALGTVEESAPGAIDLHARHGLPEQLGGLPGPPAPLGLPVIRRPLARLHGLGAEDHQHGDDLVLAQKLVFHRRPVDHLIDGLAVRVALVGLVRGPLVR